MMAVELYPITTQISRFQDMMCVCCAQWQNFHFADSYGFQVQGTKNLESVQCHLIVIEVNNAKSLENQSGGLIMLL